MAIAMARAGVFYDTSIVVFMLFAVIAMVARHAVPDVAGRADHRQGHRQRRLADHLHRHRAALPARTSRRRTRSASQGRRVSCSNLVPVHRRSRSSSSSRSSSCIRASAAFRCSKRAAWSAARCSRAARRYIPLRLNNAGVISIIFAISILLLPQQALSWFNRGGSATRASWPASDRVLHADVYFSPNSFLYNLVYFLLVVVFTFFY